MYRLFLVLEWEESVFQLLFQIRLLLHFTSSLSHLISPILLQIIYEASLF